MAIIDFFDRGWLLEPQGIAYVQGDESFTYHQIGELSCQIAYALQDAGFAQGIKGAVWAGNDVHAWVCTLGLWRANMCWIPVNSRNPTEETAALLDAFDCEVVFFHSDYAEQVAAARASLPKVRAWVCINTESALVAGSLQLAPWVESMPRMRPDLLVDLDDVIMLSPTGGTTGEPKGVMNTHRSLQTFCAHYLMATPYGPNDRIVNLAAAPMTHTAGVLTLPTTSRAGTVVVLPTPAPDALVTAIGAHSVTEVFLPPTVIYRLLDVPDLKNRHDFSSLRYFLYGAAPMSVRKLKLAIETFGPCMMGGFGQTEAPAAISYLTPREHLDLDGFATDERLASVGRPNPLIRVEILDDAGRIQPAGATGEICVRGDLVMKGYYKDPQRTGEVIVDGWLHTGDIGYLDADGYLHITDRKKDMIISGGFNVYPSEVEQVIWTHPAVRDCAVIGIPHPDWGETVMAVVELNEGQSVTEAELIALCKSRLGSVRSPKEVEIVSDLPRSAIGKVLKKDLRAAYWKGEQRQI